MSNISPDGNWKIELEDNMVKWTRIRPITKQKKLDPELEKRMNGTWTVEEIVASMKRSYPEIWGSEVD